MRIALTRAVPSSLEHCELTHLSRERIDVGVAEAQHTSYEQALRDAGCRVERIAPTPEFPDSVFVEDTAVLLKELAVITRPGAESRRGEVTSTAEALRPYRELAFIREPGILDGGDVLVAGKQIFVGISERTNEEGIAQLREYTAPSGYTVEGLTLRDCLHLKTAVTLVSPTTMIINPAWIDPKSFDGYALIEVDPSEPFAANALLLGDTVLFPRAFPLTARRLEDAGIPVVRVEASELAKAEGGLTCCSLVFDGDH